MKKLSLIFSLVIACCSFNANAALTQSQIIAGQKKAAAENIEKLSKQIIALKSLQSAKAVTTWHDGCGHNEPPPKSDCVPYCSLRSSSGSCLSYGSDYCATNAACVENCSLRSSNGSCLSYSSDYCGPWASCSDNCTLRSSNGSCLSYGADICN